MNIFTALVTSVTTTNDDDDNNIETIYIVTNSQVLYSRWQFITLKVQYTTLDYTRQIF
jgi:hypothetical protein